MPNNLIYSQKTINFNYYLNQNVNYERKQRKKPY